jgi:hypothetical protein
MNTFDKIRAFCRPFRIVVGVVTIGIGIYTGVYWWFLGVLPLIAGLADFCPTCIISKKCTPKTQEKE